MDKNLPPGSFTPWSSSTEEPQHMEIKGISLSLEEIKTIQRGCRIFVEQYASGKLTVEQVVNGDITWQQVVDAVLLYQRLETLKQYAEPI